MVLMLREATLKDLDAITDVVTTAMPDDPQWPYRLPGFKKYPEDTWKCTREDYRAVLEGDEAKNNRVNIITSPCNEDKSKTKIIAVGVWNFTVKDYSISDDDTQCSDRRDANVPRMKAFINTLMKFKKENFDRWYGSKQLHLAVLCTLPDYQRRGAGTAHCRWGMDYAKDKEWAITLFASPMGKQLYSHLGFDVKGTVHVQIKGEKEELFISAMTCEKPKGSDEDLSSASHRWCVTS